MGPVKIAIFDVIHDNPHITMDDLHAKLGKERARGMERQTLRSHVHQMREVLATAGSKVKLITASEHDGTGSITRLHLGGDL
jgi:hypothetical protein